MGKRSREKPQRREAKKSKAAMVGGISALLQDRAYEDAINATEGGRGSADLRALALAHDRAGQVLEAHALNQRALMVAGDDDSPAAASCRHDLAKLELGLADRGLGVPIEHVVAAKNQLERALECDLRKRIRFAECRPSRC